MSYQDRDRVIAWLDAGHGDKLTSLERTVLVTLAEYANSETGLAWPGHELLRIRWGMSARSARYAVARLHEFGLLETAQRGFGQRRARYRLSQFAVRHGELRGELPSREQHVPPTSQVGGNTSPRISQSSRSSKSVGMTYGATRSAPEGALRAAPRSSAIRKQISEALSYTNDQTDEWIKAKLDGRQPRNVDAYLLRCLNNQLADTHAKLAKVKKTGGGFTCPHCSRDDFTSKRSCGAHVGHCATTQCPDCNGTVKARDLDDHRKLAHGIDVREERRVFVHSILAQPPCMHGERGGNIPKPDGIEAGWMLCPICRNNAQRSA